MYLLLDIIVALLSLYYLGDISSNYNSNTDYAAPMAIVLVYSILHMFKGLKDINDELLNDTPYSSSYNRNQQQHYSNTAKSYNRSYGGYGGYYNKPNESVEYFSKPKAKTRTYEKELKHYPTRKEVREKIAKLNKNPFFRLKRGLCSIFGNDITAKFSEPYITVETVTEIVPEDYSAYQPKGWADIEKEEYNDVTKQMSRCCEFVIDFDGQNNINDEQHV